MPVRGMDGRKSLELLFHHTEGSDTLSKLYLGAAEVGEIMDCSESHAYKIIQRLNKELENKGYIVRPGRIPRRYLFERTGLDMEPAEEAEHETVHGFNGSGL